MSKSNIVFKSRLGGNFSKDINVQNVYRSVLLSQINGPYNIVNFLQFYK